MSRTTQAELQSRRAVSVTPLPPHKIHVVYSDGVHGNFSVKRLIDHHGAFRRLRDEKFFRRVHVRQDDGAVAWPRGIDIAPDVMHDRIGKASGKRFKRWVPVMKKGKRRKSEAVPPHGMKAGLRHLAAQGDPVALSLLYAPLDNKPVTAEESAKLDRAEVNVRAGRVVKLSPRVVLPQRLRVELDREEDGRFIVDIPALPGCSVSGANVVDSIRNAQALALEILASELRHGEREIDSIPMFRVVLPPADRPRKGRGVEVTEKGFKKVWADIRSGRAGSVKRLADM